MTSRDTRKGESFSEKGLTSRDFFGETMALEKPKRVKSEEYLAWIRTLPCVVAKHQSWSHGCKGPIEAHHIAAAGFGKVGSKPGDMRALPFCHSHHLEYHFVGNIEAFEKRYPVILEYEIRILNRAFKPKQKQKREQKPAILRVIVRCRCSQGSHELAPHKVVHEDIGTHWNCPVLRQRILIE